MNEYWDEFSDKNSDEGEESDDEDPKYKWFEIDEYRIRHNKIPKLKEEDDEYIRIRPFPPRPLPPPGPWRVQRIARKLKETASKLRGGRQCRQLQAKKECPYDEKQMSGIVSKLRQVMRGDDLLNTITMVCHISR